MGDRRFQAVSDLGRVLREVRLKKDRKRRQGEDFRSECRKAVQRRSQCQTHCDTCRWARKDEDSLPGARWAAQQCRLWLGACGRLNLPFKTIKLLYHE